MRMKPGPFAPPHKRAVRSGRLAVIAGAAGLVIVGGFLAGPMIMMATPSETDAEPSTRARHTDPRLEIRDRPRSYAELEEPEMPEQLEVPDPIDLMRLFGGDTEPEPEPEPEPAQVAYSYTPQPAEPERPKRTTMMLDLGGLDQAPQRRITRIDRRTLPRGHALDGVLISAVNSEAPGEIMVQVAHDPRGLVPPGALVLCSYRHASSRFVDSRLSIGCDELQADGVAVPISAYLADATGAGVAGDVDRHWGPLLGGAAINTIGGAAITSAGRSLGGDFAGDIAAGGVREGVGITRDITRQTLDASPTISIEPGVRLRVVLTEPLRL